MKRRMALCCALLLCLSALFGCGGEAVKGNAGQKNLAQVDEMPAMASNYKLIDYAALAREVDRVLYDFVRYAENPPYDAETLTPIGWWDDNAAYGRAFGFPAYIGASNAASRSGQEGITVLGSLVASTYAGIDKSAQEFTDEDNQKVVHNFVAMAKQFYNDEVGFVLDHGNSPTGETFWYEIYPQILFAKLYTLYPDETWMEEIILTGAENWHRVLPNFRTNGEWDFAFKSYDFRSDMPVYGSDWNEPPNGGLSYLFYNAYLLTGEEKFLDDCKIVLDYLEQWNKNPYYEILQDYACYVAAVLNAFHGTDYDIQKFANVSFEGSGDFRNSAQVVNAKWGNYDAYGLMAFSYSDTSGAGYAFAMNTFHMASTLAPMLAYDARFADDVGKWFYHMTNSARIFYGSEVPLENQSCPEATAGDPNKSIAYEGVKTTVDGKTPYAMGDQSNLGWGGATDYGIYGGVHVGILGAIVSPTDVEQIIRVDLNKTDTLGLSPFQKYLYYNPYPNAREVTLELTQPATLYNTVTGEVVGENLSGSQKISLPAEGAAVIALLPADASVTAENGRVNADGQFLALQKPAVDILSPAEPKQTLTSKSVLELEAEGLPDDALTYMAVRIGDELIYEGDPLTSLALDDIPSMRAGVYNLQVRVRTASGLTDTASIRVRVL